MEKNIAFIGLGSNLGGTEFDGPRGVLEAAIFEMPNLGISVKKISPFYESAPVPVSDQPWFVNAVAMVETSLCARDLLHNLHEIEARLGRIRRIRWEARIIDLDIIAYGDLIVPTDGKWPGGAPKEMIIPHPRLHERLFVLKPLMDICSAWRHPALGVSVKELYGRVKKDGDQSLRPMMDK